MSRTARSEAADRIRAVRPPSMRRCLLAAAGLSALIVATLSAPAFAQVQVTPEFSVTPSKTVTPWVFQMAVGAVIIGVLAVLFIAASYLRFAPRFFGRREAAPAP